MDKNIQLYVNVNPDGTIKKVVSGEPIVASENYHYYFLKPEKVANEAHLYKVVINNMVPELVLKDDIPGGFFVNEEWNVIEADYEEVADDPEQLQNPEAEPTEPPTEERAE